MPMANETSNIFEPVVFQEMVNALEPAQGLLLLNSTKTETSDSMNIGWDIHFGAASTVAPLNVPNSKATLAPRQGAKRNQGIASLAYVRHGDRFEFTNSQFLKDPSTPLDSGVIQNGEEKVAEQVKLVADSIDNTKEIALWSAIRGNYNYTSQLTGPVSVDYKFRASHKIVLPVGAQWDNPALVDFRTIINNIRAAKRVIEVDGGVPVLEVFASRQTLDLLLDAWQRAMLNSSTPEKFLSDRMISEYMSTGKITGDFMGVNTWTAVDENIPLIKEDGSIEVTSNIPHGTLVLANRTANNALKMVIGPSADFDAPRGHTGRFAKTWLDSDPTGRQFLIEESFLPIITRPDQFATVKVASDTWINGVKWNS